MDEPITPESRPAEEKEPAIPPTIFEHLDDHEKPLVPVNAAFEEPKKSKIFPVLLVVLVVAILGSGYCAYKELYNKKKAKMNTTASTATTAATSSTNSNSNNPADDQLDKDMTDVNSQFKSLSSETNSIDNGMADQPVDLNSD